MSACKSTNKLINAPPLRPSQGQTADQAFGPNSYANATTHAVTTTSESADNTECNIGTNKRRRPGTFHEVYLKT